MSNLVGKILKGNVQQISKINVLTTKPDGSTSLVELIQCGSPSLSVKFLSQACQSRLCDYIVELVIELGGITNKFKTIASVDKNCNIQLVEFARYNLIINLSPLPPLLENLLIECRLIFTKVKGKNEYNLSGNLNGSVIFSFQGIKNEINDATIVKGGTFTLN